MTTTYTLNSKKLFADLGKEFAEVIQLISDTAEKDINAIPYKNSWTPGQLVSHITKSNKGIAQALEMEGKTCDRDPAIGVEKIKKVFLDFDAKYQSPEFIIPSNGPFVKSNLIEEYARSCDKLKEKGSTVDLTEIIDLPAFGETTKFEILNLVVYHTQRHIRQLKNILNTLKKTKRFNN